MARSTEKVRSGYRRLRDRVMMQVIGSVVTYLVVGGLGGFLCTKLKVPAGALIGSLMAVVLFKLMLSAPPNLPKGFSFAAQVLLGILIGATFKRDMLAEFPQVALMVISSTLLLVVSGFVLTLVLYKLGLLDMQTAYLGTNPGAMSALVVLAHETQSNSAVVLIFHFFRVVFVILTAPWILRLLSYWQ